MSIQRRVRKPDQTNPEERGLAGYLVEGLPHTYEEHHAKRLQYLKMDGSNEYDLPEDGVLAEVNPDKLRGSAAQSNPSGRP